VGTVKLYCSLMSLHGLPWQEDNSAVVCNDLETHCSRKRQSSNWGKRGRGKRGRRGCGRRAVERRPGEGRLVWYVRVVKGSPLALRMLVKYTVPAPSQGKNESDTRTRASESV
jgi:hypothetical protein